MADTPGNGARRLDSWKAIAAYLGRDVRTLQRWEQQLGLPVRRLPGGRGTSVFAYAWELDAWLTTNHPGNGAASGPPPPPQRRRRWAGFAAAALVVAVGALTGWRALRVSATAADLTLTMTDRAIVASDAAGRTQWQYTVPGHRLDRLYERDINPGEILEGDRPTVIAATGLLVSIAQETIASGRLLLFTPQGALQRSFELNDQLTLGDGVYKEPWALTDFRVTPGTSARRIAVAAHHYEWSPSIITVLDDQWRRLGTFVNAGWLERVHWLSPDTLLAGGFFEPLDGGAVALLDATALDGQSPVAPDSRFFCKTCGEGRPRRYVVMPRSEVNRASGSRFNRARLEIHPDRIVARTQEAVLTETDIAEAIYEFTPSLDLVRASFSERYWQIHQSLEAQGKLTHTRARCPDRDGPGALQVWERATGWRALPARR